MSQHHLFSRLLIGLSCLAPISLLSAKSIFHDETSLSFGLARHDFRVYSLDINADPDYIQQHYHAVSPTADFTLRKEFADRWHSFWAFNLHYDMNLDSNNALNNGRAHYDAHSWNAELKSYVLYDSDVAQGVRVGMGVGLGNFALETYTPTNEGYTNYGHMLAPIFRIEKDYSFVGLPGRWAAEISRLDFFGYADGNGYCLENTLWIKKDADVEQGIKIQFIYWDLDGGIFFKRRWMNDFHGISWCMELKFR